MAEKNNSVFELENEEMANVSGGRKGFIQEPHCRECGQKLDNYGGEYKCTTEGCSLKGKTQYPQNLNWY